MGVRECPTPHLCIRDTHPKTQKKTTPCLVGFQPRNLLFGHRPRYVGCEKRIRCIKIIRRPHTQVHTCHTIACNSRVYAQKTTNMVWFVKPPARVTKLHPSPPWPSGCPFGRSGPPSRAPSGSGGREGNSYQLLAHQHVPHHCALPTVKSPSRSQLTPS